MRVSAWRRRWWLWAMPLALVLLCGAVLSTYRLIYAGRVAALRGQIDREQEELEILRGQRQRLEELVADAAGGRRGIQKLYRETFATESERLAALIREVKELATRSGLTPGAISYPDEEIEEHGLIRRSMAFAVEGGYADLRKFVNLLEQSDSFVSLRAVRLTEADPKLRIGLELSTLFAGRDRPIREADSSEAQGADA